MQSFCLYELTALVSSFKPLKFHKNSDGICDHLLDAKLHKYLCLCNCLRRVTLAETKLESKTLDLTPEAVALLVGEVPWWIFALICESRCGEVMTFQVEAGSVPCIGIPFVRRKQRRRHQA